MFARNKINVILFSILLCSILIGCSRPVSTDPIVTKKDKRWNLPERVLKYQQLIAETESSADQIVADYVPKSMGQIEDLGLHVKDILFDLPGVISVTGLEVDSPTGRIIHLFDNPLPTKEEFFVCLKKMADGGVTSTQLDSLYEDYLRQLELMQLVQTVVLRCLVKHHGLRHVFAEGLTQTALPAYRAKIASLRDSGIVTDGNKREDGSQQQASEISRRRLDLLELGVAGRMLMLSEIEEVRPLDDPELIRRSTRYLVSTIDRQSRGHSKIRLGKTQEAMDNQIKTILHLGPFGLITGNDDDLTDNLYRISDGKCEYLRVTTKWASEVSPLEPNVWGR